MESRHIYTSTGVKFWRHPLQMVSYLRDEGNSVISTHISPTSKCNLNCQYCSVKKRDKTEEIDVGTIIDYLYALKSRGLKGVIFTGGGEPTQYSKWNYLMNYIEQSGQFDYIKFGLITNGVDLGDKHLHNFDWIRVSLNYGHEEKIDLFNAKSDCTIGLSLIYSYGNKRYSLEDLLWIIRRHNAEYLRILPDCTLDNIYDADKEIDKFLYDPRYATQKIIHQKKWKRAPMAIRCHQSYFRPYLSEIDGGTVFPCDSVVLNGSPGKFEAKYAICKAKDVRDFLDHKISVNFDPNRDCEGCVFTENVEMLEMWRHGGHSFNNPETFKPIKHEDFV